MHISLSTNVPLPEARDSFFVEPRRLPPDFAEAKKEGEVREQKKENMLSRVCVCFVCAFSQEIDAPASRQRPIRIDKTLHTIFERQERTRREKVEKMPKPLKAPTRKEAFHSLWKQTESVKRNKARRKKWSWFILSNNK